MSVHLSHVVGYNSLTCAFFVFPTLIHEGETGNKIVAMGPKLHISPRTSIWRKNTNVVCVEQADEGGNCYIALLELGPEYGGRFTN